MLYSIVIQVKSSLLSTTSSLTSRHFNNDYGLVRLLRTNTTVPGAVMCKLSIILFRLYGMVNVVPTRPTVMLFQQQALDYV